ncbi:leucine-rich repeat-containing protein 42-like [Anneissia japonica]|uniref:leucine-rich repeat-containing protein 42-like n=1 Tax=Anneissia japonica TaxID=1529436 RepID=UPI0014257161|nr:leucine-rich repeat-containing protein 42-like [Anneissia japonica]
MPPQKLLDLCLDFVSQNVQHVESFEYIPDVVGKQIFKRIIQLEKSGKAYCIGTKSLKLLVSTYGTDLLTSLSLVNQRDVLDKYSEKFDVLLDCDGLVSLDFGNCCLNDEHPILKVIARMKRLKNLGLSYNLISRAGIRCLTTPVRMLKDGPVDLASLQLAGNLQINDSSIRYLLAFKQLKFLDVSDNFISNEGVMSLCESLHLTFMADDRKFVEISTSGWASPLVHIWLQEKPQPTAQLIHFYGDVYSKKVKRNPQTQVSRNIRLIASSFNKADSNMLDSVSGKLHTYQPCLPHSIKLDENSEKRGINNDEDSEDNGRRKKRKLNELNSVSLPHKHQSGFRRAFNKTLKEKTKVKNKNIKVLVPMAVKMQKIKDAASSNSTLLSALDCAEDESCEQSIKGDYNKNKETTNTPTNQLKPLPIKKFKLKKR